MQVLPMLRKKLSLNIEPGVKYLEGKKKYDEHIQQTGGDYKAIALAREKLVKQRNDLTSSLHNAKTRKDKLKVISERRDNKLDELEAIYLEYTREKKGKMC